jgi:hypothetical protein
MNITELKEKHQQARSRNKLLMQTKENYKDYLFKEQQRIQLEGIEQLITKNRELLQAQNLTYITPSFMYKGTLYASWILPVYEYKGCNKLIHPDMQEPITKAINFNDFEAMVEERKLLNFIENVLTNARTRDDLFELIPSRIHEPLQYVGSGVFDIGSSMSSSEIAEFKETYKAGLSAFKRLFLERLLLS